MKKLIPALLLLMSTITFANIQCGIPPIPPPGCVAACFCDVNGNCVWKFLCK